MSTEIFYVVSVECKEVRDFTGSVRTNPGKTVWLAENVDRFGSVPDRSKAKRFDHIPSVAEIDKYNMQPWYHVFEQGTAKVYEVTVETPDPVTSFKRVV